jgi:hypothetical protein
MRFWPMTARPISAMSAFGSIKFVPLPGKPGGLVPD